MSQDKYSAVWVSHSSLGDYLKCPRSYYLKNIYRNPETNRKISLTSPALTLGQTVHEVVESLSQLPVSERFLTPLEEKYKIAWEKVSGKKGGFKDSETENKSYQKGISMLTRLQNNPGPLLHKTIKIRQQLPYYWLSDDENIILCGKIDWLEYLEASDKVNIIDFKTGKYDEDPDSLQLPIYLLLATNCQSREVAGAFYWYLDRDDIPVSVSLPDKESAYVRVLNLAKKVALARKLNNFPCPKIGGCRSCLPFEQIVSGQAERVGLNDYGQEIYFLNT
jgi:ATP-dependent helicase/DNAse subunit B